MSEIEGKVNFNRVGPDKAAQKELPHLNLGCLKYIHF